MYNRDILCNTEHVRQFIKLFKRPSIDNVCTCTFFICDFHILVFHKMLHEDNRWRHKKHRFNNNKETVYC
jgi:hypothetical protein